MIAARTKAWNYRMFSVQGSTVHRGTVRGETPGHYRVPRTGFGAAFLQKATPSFEKTMRCRGPFHCSKSPYLMRTQTKGTRVSTYTELHVYNHGTAAKTKTSVRRSTLFLNICLSRHLSGDTFIKPAVLTFAFSRFSTLVKNSSCCVSLLTDEYFKIYI